MNMKTQAIVGLGATMIAIVGTALAQVPPSTWNFQGDKVDVPPAGFTFGRTGSGRAGKWVVLVDGTAPAGDHVLAQVDTDDTDNRFPFAVANAPVLKDVRVEVRCKAVSGRTDEACGLVFRFQDENNYYVTRANALEDNVRLYHVVKGQRRQIAGWDGKVAPGVWHTLAIEARGDKLKVIWNGKTIIETTDGTLSQAGKIGMWTKADSVTYFDALAVTPLP
jgi:hypothetical protein